MWQLFFGAFSADGKLFACGGEDEKATIYETGSWAVVQELEHSGWVSEGRRGAVEGSGGRVVWAGWAAGGSGEGLGVADVRECVRSCA